MTMFSHIGMQRTGMALLQLASGRKAAEPGSFSPTYPSTSPSLDQEATETRDFTPHAVANRRTTCTPAADMAKLPRQVGALKDEIGISGHPGVGGSDDFSRSEDRDIRELRRLVPENEARLTIHSRRQHARIDYLYGQTLKVRRNTRIDGLVPQQQWQRSDDTRLRGWAGVFGCDRIILRTSENMEGVKLRSDFLSTFSEAGIAEDHFADQILLPAKRHDRMTHTQLPRMPRVRKSPGTGP